MGLQRTNVRDIKQENRLEAKVETKPKRVVVGRTRGEAQHLKDKNGDEKWGRNMGTKKFTVDCFRLLFYVGEK